MDQHNFSFVVLLFNPHPPRWNGGWWFGGEGFPVVWLWNTVACAENSHVMDPVSDRVLSLRKSIDNCAFTRLLLWIWWWFRLWMLIFFFYLSTRFAEYRNNTEDFFLAQNFLPLKLILRNIFLFAAQFWFTALGKWGWRSLYFEPDPTWSVLMCCAFL